MLPGGRVAGVEQLLKLAKISLGLMHVVTLSPARAMAKALRKRDKPVELYIYEDEIHGFQDPRNRINFYSKLAAFFELHLAPRPAAASATK